MEKQFHEKISSVLGGILKKINSQKLLESREQTENVIIPMYKAMMQQDIENFQACNCKNTLELEKVQRKAEKT